MHSDRRTLVIIAMNYKRILVYGVLVYLASGVLIGLIIAIYAAGLAFEARGAPDSALIDAFGQTTGYWGGPALGIVLTFLATIHLARRVTRRQELHGALVGVITGLFGTLTGILFGFGPELLDMASAFIGVAAGWLGGSVGRAASMGRERLLDASRDMSVVHDSEGLVRTIGRYLDGGEVCALALLSVDVTCDELVTTASWSSVGARPISVGRRLARAALPVDLQEDGAVSVTLSLADVPPELRDLLVEHGASSCGLFPTGPASNRRALAVFTSRSRGLRRSTWRAAETLAASASLLLQNLDLQAEARERGVLQERERLARDIHDSIAQGFTSIVMRLEAAEASLSSNGGAVLEHLDAARDIARDGLEETRHLVWALRPPSLDRADLEQVLRSMAERWSRESGVPATLKITGDSRPLRPGSEVALLRVAQEALTNVRRHAHASAVILELSFSQDAVALDIRDDGVGLAATTNEGLAEQSKNAGSAFGMESMRRRVEQAGGEFVVESAPEQGTRIMARIGYRSGARHFGEPGP